MFVYMCLGCSVILFSGICLVSSKKVFQSSLKVLKRCSFLKLAKPLLKQKFKNLQLRMWRLQKGLRMKLSLLTILLLATSCVSTQKTNDYCLITKTINPTNKDIDVISDQLVQDILLHNETYEKLCRPISKPNK